MRTFKLVRTEDVTGVSGTGVVAEGVVFEDGSAAMRWKTETASTAVYDSIEDVERIHGHGGSTKVRFDQVVTLAVNTAGSPAEINRAVRQTIASHEAGRS
jgi:hypothetical protein